MIPALICALLLLGTTCWLAVALWVARDERDAAREDYESECADHAKTARERDDWKGLARIYHLARNLAREKTVQALRERDAAHLSVEIMACESSAQRLAEMVRMGRVA